MSPSSKALHKTIKVRLFLDAVLPAFEDFLAQNGAAKHILGDRCFTISFQTSSGLKSFISFANRGCSVTKTSDLGSDIVIHFLSEEQLIKEFEKTGFRLPIPIRGASRLKDIKIFKQLSALFELSLRPPKEELQNLEFRQHQVALQLGIALRAAVILIQYEPRSKRILADIDHRLAHFSIGSEGYGAWIKIENGILLTGKGKPIREPDVSITFKDAETALLAIGNRIDVLAAVGLQDVIIDGYAPFADALGYIFERIPIYISP